MRFKVIYLIVFLGLLAGFSQSFAQQRDAATIIERIRTELEQTNEIIQRAKEAVQSSASPTGRLALEQAVQLQKMAWENFFKRTEEGFKAAAGLTTKARELAMRAIESSRLTEENEDAILRKLERATEQMQRLREMMPSDVPAHVQSLFQAARENLQKAWEFYRARKFRPAVKLCTQVERTVQKIFNTVRNQDRRESDFQRRAEKIRGQLERLTEQMAECANENAAGFLEQAKNAFRKAIEFATQGQMEPARATLHKASQLASMAAKACNSGDRIESRYLRIKKAADDMRERIEPGDETARRLIEQAYKQLEMSKSHLESGQQEAAAASLKAAELTLRQLKRYLDNTGF